MISHELIAKAGIGQPWILSKLKRPSKRLLSIMTAPIALCLMGLLSGCSSIQTEYVQVPPIPIPAHLLADCLPPVIPDKMTWSDSLILNEQLLTVIEQCNLDKQA
ncbi:Rz1-like lysis system protein LysC, partial [Xenorhabdus bovienii]|uniref:Rz1-like lysis system protein LysC n=1 Tax=Xenorhabdus bovienii TaxID=40576 RepID=UPI003DA4B595